MPVFVLGMHRSGTSALTRCLNLLGLTLGRDDHLLAANVDNPRGFWENANLSQFNEEILTAMGGSWLDPPFTSDASAYQQGLDDLKARARELLAREGVNTPYSCWKDPRVCLTMPFWQGLFDHPPIVVFINRNPLEVWRSLDKRNGFQKRHVLALWTIYVRAAMLNMTSLPVFSLSYESLLQDPLPWLSRIKAFLESNGLTGLHAPPAEEVQGFLSSDIRHWRSRPDELDYDPEATVSQKMLFRVLCGLPTVSERFECPRVPDVAETLEYHATTRQAHVAVLRSEIEKAGEARAALVHEIEQAREYQETLERHIVNLERPRVDIMIVNYNGDKWIDGFVDSLRGVSYPAERLRLVFVDNASTDGSYEHAQKQAANLPFPTEFVQTGYNAGFAGGYVKAFEYGIGAYYFVINSDTRLAPDAIDKLIAVLEADPQAGIAEARQSPLEHPKYYDPVTRETSWCSGACMMVRERALHGTEGGFDPYFFMYAEDVDLSWRMWLRGWKCLYVPEAKVEHFTEHLDPQRNRSIQFYFSMRNGALMRTMYGSWSEVLVYYAAMLREGLFSGQPRAYKWLTLKAILTSLKRLPHSLRRRRSLRRLGPHRWVFFDGWLYGRHDRDPSSAGNPDDESAADLVSTCSTAEHELKRDLPLDTHIKSMPGVVVCGCPKPAILVYDSARLHFHLKLPRQAQLIGAIAAPEDTWKPSAVGRFEISQDGEQIWQQELKLENWLHRQWVPFAVPLRPAKEGDTSRITLSFDGKKDLGWGLWGDVRVRKTEDTAGRDDRIDQLAGVVVSVIVPTHNRADRLEYVIRRIMSQDIPAERFEVIVVDSNSTDRTPQVTAELARRYRNLVPLRANRPGAAAARNMGIEKAQGSLLVLLDDDIMVGTDFLRRILRGRADHANRVLLGKIATLWENSSDPFERYLLQSRAVNTYDFPEDFNVPANYFFTACVAIPREILGKLRFDEGFQVYGVEDLEFGFRLLGADTKMVFLPNVSVLHDYHPRFQEYRQNKLKAGYSLGYFLSTHPEHADRFQFGEKFQRNYQLLRLIRFLTAPAAALIYLYEKMMYRKGPVNHRLEMWWAYDLRMMLYAGLRRFRNGLPPP
jgi:GT2 family glycosyltransferase